MLSTGVAWFEVALPPTQCPKTFHGCGIICCPQPLELLERISMFVSEEGTHLSETEGAQSCVARKRQRRKRTWICIWVHSLGMTFPTAQGTTGSLCVSNLSL